MKESFKKIFLEKDHLITLNDSVQINELGIELIEETMLFSWVSKCSLAEIIFFYVKVKTEFNLLELNEGQKMAVFYFDELDKLDLTPDIVANKDRFKSFLNGGILAR